MLRTLCALGIMIATNATAAHAQDTTDVVVMRRVIAPPSANAPVPSSALSRVVAGAADGGGNVYRQTGHIQLQVTAVGCEDQRTGKPVATSAACLALAGGPAVGDLVRVASIMDPDLKRVHVTSDEFKRAFPSAARNQALLAALCSSAVTIESASWPISCDPASVVNSHEWRATDVGGDTGASLNPVAGSAVAQLKIANADCYHVATGAKTDAQSCSSITKGRPGTPVEVSAEWQEELREVYVDPAALRAYQVANPQGPSSACNAPLSVGPVSSRQTWTVVCGPADDPSRYASRISRLDDPYNTDLMTLKQANSSPTASDLKLYVSSKSCYYQDGSAAPANKCRYLSQGPQLYDVVSLPATFTTTRESFITKSDLVAATAPGALVLGKTVDAACAGADFTLYMPSSGQSWKMLCGTPEENRYRREAQRLDDPNETYPATNPSVRNINSDFAATAFKFTVAKIHCWDYVLNKAATSDRCTAQAAGTNIYDIVSVPAVFVAARKEVYFKQEDLLKALPHAGQIHVDNYYGASVAQRCQYGTMNLVIGPVGNRQTWKLKCGQP